MGDRNIGLGDHMPVESDNPTTIPAQPEIQANTWYIESLVKRVSNPGENVVVDTVMFKYGSSGSLVVVDPNSRVAMTISVEDITTDEDTAIGVVLDGFSEIRSNLRAGGLTSNYAALIELEAQCIGAIAKIRGAIS